MTDSIELRPVSLADQSVLRNLMELYRHDFSEIEHDDVDEHGLFGYAYLDNYQTEADRSAFLVRVDGRLAGFVLLRHVDDHTMEIAEFFVMRGYRRRGVGVAVANEVFTRFPGRWRFFALVANAPAVAFWRSATAAYDVREEEGAHGEQSVIFFDLRT